jgi:hypothetical protein
MAGMMLNVEGLGSAARVLVRLAALGALTMGGCRPAASTSRSPAPTAGRETVITEVDIGRMSVRTAWDIVRMRAPKLTYGQDASGRPSRVRIQEPRSVSADETPLLVVDGAQVGDLQFLNEIPASDVHLIRIIDGEAATQLYGIRAASGAIVVETKH